MARRLGGDRRRQTAVVDGWSFLRNERFRMTNNPEPRANTSETAVRRPPAAVAAGPVAAKRSASAAILLLEPLHDDAVTLLADYARVFQVETPEQAMQVARTNDVHAILTRGKGRVTREMIVACKNLKAVSRAGAGVDTIDVEAARAHDIKIVFAPGVNAATTAEHTFMLMLMIARRAAELTQRVKAGDWASRNAYQGIELRWKTLGLVGLGAIGREVALRAAAFGMQVLGLSRSSAALDAQPPAGVTFASWQRLLAESDFVSLHVPLKEDTRGIFGAAQIAAMKRGAFLINTARGALVDKRALAAALDDGRVAGYAADVFDPQPPAQEDMALIERSNVILTPHVAGLTDATYRQVCLFCARNVLAVLENGAPDTRSLY
jgi:D-3-phosphoglycerate dehydrogenase / 2-oxoglutarate reductase